MFLGLRTAIYHVDDIERPGIGTVQFLASSLTSMSPFMLGSMWPVMNWACNRLQPV